MEAAYVRFISCVYVYNGNLEHSKSAIRRSSFSTWSPWAAVEGILRQKKETDDDEVSAAISDTSMYPNGK